MTAKRLMMLAGSVCLAATLAACNPQGGMEKLTVAVQTTMTKTDNVLARLAGNEIPSACSIIGVAEGYFRALEHRISADKIRIERQAEAAVAEICNDPPTNTAQAFGKLVKLWFTIQDATKAS